VKARRAHVFITGQVQGVGFRDFTQHEATKRGLAGWVKNLEDGRVEAVIEGPADKVAELLELVKRGPPNARVDKVETADETPTGEFKVFSVRR
jgi:acylphosphatase